MLRDKLARLDIVLASQSPRRQELLGGLDIDFRIETRPVDEQYSADLRGAEITDFLSKLKAKAFTQDIKPDQLVITSDTIVWLDDRALEKPKNHVEAVEMLKSMSGQTHSVFTSVAFTTENRTEVINDKTKVTFAQLSIEEIRYYVENYSPYDRAGAYGIQDWIGYVGVEKIDGCYYNVMGLPLPKVYAYLKKLTQ
jgi:septum formation protein